MIEGFIPFYQLIKLSHICEVFSTANHWRFQRLVEHQKKKIPKQTFGYSK